MAKVGTNIRGLQVFISDIRACASKEAEALRVEKELIKIRKKFGGEKKVLTGVCESGCLFASVRAVCVCVFLLRAGLRRRRRRSTHNKTNDLN